MVEAQSKLKMFERFGSKLGLDRMEELLHRLGNPEKDLRVIHVAGTNGKGSVCSFMANMLIENGYSVGLYTSPFVEDFHERIQVNGIKIGDEDLDKYTKEVIEMADRMVVEGLESPTEFEVVTAVALRYFADRDLDFTILEVGLGGSGDSTNVADRPLLSIITSISFDHTERLGDTIKEIAAEKAGIIKEGCPVISNIDNDDAKKVIARVAYGKNAPLIDASKIEALQVIRSKDNYSFSVEIKGKFYLEISISMLGDHQVRNAICALTAIDYLRREKLISITKEGLLKGMLQAKQPGRFELFGKIILDGAHNDAGAKALETTMRELFSGRDVLTVVGLLNDKDAAGITTSLSAFTKEFIVTEPPSDRKLEADSLSEYIDKPYEIVTNPDDAYKRALSKQDDFDVVLFVGSLYLIGHIRRYVN